MAVAVALDCLIPCVLSLLYCFYGRYYRNGEEERPDVSVFLAQVPDVLALA